MKIFGKMFKKLFQENLKQINLKKKKSNADKIRKL